MTYTQKMLRTISHQIEANQNHNETSSHQSEWLLSDGQQITNVGEGVDKREPSGTVGGNVCWFSHSEKHREIPQKLKTKN